MTNVSQEYSNPLPLEIGKPIRWFQQPTARQLRFAVFLALFYVIPYLVIWIMEWDMLYRHIVAGVTIAVLVLYAIRYRRNWRKMGFRMDTLTPAFLWFGVLTLFLTILMLIADHYHWVRISAYPLQQNWHLLLYFFIIAPFQELVYRGLLFLEMKRMGILNPFVQVLISAALFSFEHIHYHDWVTVGLTLVAGLIWGWVYLRHPNWLAVTLSHGILGSVALLTHIV